MVADDEILPVLIVGAGPVGLVLSMLLTKFGTFLDFPIWSPLILEDFGVPMRFL